MKVSSKLKNDLFIYDIVLQGDLKLKFMAKSENSKISKTYFMQMINTSFILNFLPSTTVTIVLQSVAKEL